MEQRLFRFVIPTFKVPFILFVEVMCLYTGPRQAVEQGCFDRAFLCTFLNIIENTK